MAQTGSTCLAHTGKEKAVRAGAGRGKRHRFSIAAVRTGCVRAEDFLPGLHGGPGGKLRVVTAEALDLPVVFFRQDGTGDVDEAAAGLDEEGGLRKRLLLLGDALFEIFGGETPFGVGPAPPCAGAGAGGVDQYGVDL